MSRYIFIISLSFLLQITRAQTGSVLESYIQQGLSNNLALQQKNINLEKSLLALKEANGLFYPSVSLNSQYTFAKGGRAIDLPIGDLFNPVYSSLNHLLENNGENGSFPQIENQKINFLPNNYHDTKMEVVLPLVNAEIYYNRKIKKEFITFSQAENNVFKRELVKEIKTAYFKYLQASSVVEAYKSASELVAEGLRVSDKLVKNEMAGKDKLLRMKAEFNQVQAQLTKAVNDQKNAVAYFNFILNQPLESPLITDSSLLVNLSSGYMNKNIVDRPREEIAQLQSAIKANDYSLKLTRNYWLPTINYVGNFGYQGYQYKFNNEQHYMMNVLDFRWNIFTGFQNRSKIASAKLEITSLQKKLDETENQMILQEQIARNNFQSSIEAEKASLSELESSREYYKVVRREYSEGQKSMLDLLDARNQLTNAEIGYNAAHYDTLIRLAELEREIAGYKFNDKL